VLFAYQVGLPIECPIFEYLRSSGQLLFPSFDSCSDRLFNIKFPFMLFGPQYELSPAPDPDYASCLRLIPFPFRFMVFWSILQHLFFVEVKEGVSQLIFSVRLSASSL